MIKLKNILNEIIYNKNKTQLSECFIEDTFIDLFNENPKIFNILSGNIIDMDGDVRDDLKSKEDIAEDFTHIGGALGYDGIWDWNKSKVLKFFKDLYESDAITESTYNLLLIEMKKDYNVFTMDYMEDMIKRVGDKMFKLYNDSEWYEIAKQELEYIKKGLTQQQFKNPKTKTCNI